LGIDIMIFAPIVHSLSHWLATTLWIWLVLAIAQIRQARPSIARPDPCTCIISPFWIWRGDDVGHCIVRHLSHYVRPRCLACDDLVAAKSDRFG
jgi:hypothetical protein